MMTAAILLGATLAIGAGYYIRKRAEFGGTVRPKVLVLSASDTHGGYFDPYVLQRYSPTPVQMISEASGLACYDETLNGLQLCELLVGGDVAFAAPDPGQLPTIKPLQQLLDEHPDCKLVMLGAGMNDVLFGGRTIEQLMTDVETAVNMILLAGKTPIIRGFHNFAVTTLMTVEKIAINTAANTALQTKAAALGVPFMDTHSVTFNGVSDIAVDGLHPTADYHQRLCAFQASRLAEIAQSI